MNELKLSELQPREEFWYGNGFYTIDGLECELPVGPDCRDEVQSWLDEINAQSLRIRQLEAAVAALSGVWEYYVESTGGHRTAAEIIEEAMKGVK